MWIWAVIGIANSAYSVVSDSFTLFFRAINVWKADVMWFMNKVAIYRCTFKQLEILIRLLDCQKDKFDILMQMLNKQVDPLLRSLVGLSANSLQFLLCKYHMKDPHNCTFTRNRKFYVIFDTFHIQMRRFTHSRMRRWEQVDAAAIRAF